MKVFDIKKVIILAMTCAVTAGDIVQAMDAPAARTRSRAPMGSVPASSVWSGAADNLDLHRRLSAATTRGKRLEKERDAERGMTSELTLENQEFSSAIDLLSQERGAFRAEARRRGESDMADTDSWMEKNKDTIHHGGRGRRLVKPTGYCGYTVHRLEDVVDNGSIDNNDLGHDITESKVEAKAPRKSRCSSLARVAKTVACSPVTVPVAILKWGWRNKKLVLLATMVAFSGYQALHQPAASSVPCTPVPCVPTKCDPCPGVTCPPVLPCAPCPKTFEFELRQCESERDAHASALSSCHGEVLTLKTRVAEAEGNETLTREELKAFTGTVKPTWSWLKPWTWRAAGRAQENCEIACDAYFGN